MQSGWGAGLSLGSGLELDLYQPVLRIGLSDYRPVDGNCFFELIFSALENFCTQVEQKTNPQWELLWQGALNSLDYEEYALGEYGGNEGLYALERCLQLARASYYYHDVADIFASLDTLKSIAILRAQGLVGFVAKIRRYTLENPYWTLQLFEEVFIKPQPILPGLPLSERELAEQEEQFRQYQMRSDDPKQSAKITAMRRSELGSLPAEPPYEYFKEQEMEFFCSGRAAENSLVQIGFYWEISTWSEAQSVLLPLFIDLVEDMGTPNLHYAEVAKQKSLFIGHWAAEFCFKPVFRPLDTKAPLRSFVHIQLSFLPTEWRKGLALFWQLLSDANWYDSARLRELLQSRYYEKIQNLCANPLPYAMRRSCYRASSLPDILQSARLQARQSEWLYGLGQLELLAYICRQDILNKNIGPLAQDFCLLRQALLKVPLSCTLSASQQQLGLVRREIIEQQNSVSAQMPSQILALVNKESWPDSLWADVVRPSLASQAVESLELWQGRLSLEYLSLAIPTRPWTYTGTCIRSGTLHPASELLARLLQNGPAWERIRLQQGAYGVRVEQKAGCLLFCSSEDPNAFDSIELFLQSIEDIHRASQKSHYLSEFEAALVQTLAEKLRAPLQSEYPIIGWHLAKTGLKYKDQEEWLRELREMSITDLFHSAEHVLKNWHSVRASCIFTGDISASAITKNPTDLFDSHDLPGYA